MPCMDAHPPPPIQRLVPDILTKIFMLVCDNNTVSNKDEFWSYLLSWPRIAPYPLPLSHVCRPWHHIVIHNPLLWTDLRVFPPWKLELIRLFFKRSGSCQIDFYLYATERVYWLRRTARSESDSRVFLGTECEKVQELIEILKGHFDRFRNITIQADYDFRSILELFEHHFKDHSPSLPYLRKLHLEELLNPDQDVVFVPRNFINLDMPLLTDLRLATHIKLLPHFFPAQLRTLHMHVGFFSWLYLSSDLIRNCRSLENLALYNELDSLQDWSLPQAKFELPFLSSLQLYDISSSKITALFSMMSTPNLRYLVVASFDPEDFQELDQYVLSHGINKFPAVKSLTLALVQDNDSYLNSTVRFAGHWFPWIEEAIFVGPGAPALIDHALRNTDTRKEVIWPHLRTLAIRKPLIRPFEVFASRAAVGCPIRTLYVNKRTLEDQPELAFDYNVVERDMWTELRRSGLASHLSFGSADDDHVDDDVDD